MWRLSIAMGTHSVFGWNRFDLWLAAYMCPRRFWSPAREPDASVLRRSWILAYNGGQVRSVMTVYAPADKSSGQDLRIWNHQLCGYAGYRDVDGRVTGDPKNADFRELLKNAF